MEGGSAPHHLKVGADGGKQGQSHLQGTCVVVLRKEGRNGGWQYCRERCTNVYT